MLFSFQLIRRNRERNSFEALGTWIESDHDTKASVLVMTQPLPRFPGLAPTCAFLKKKSLSILILYELWVKKRQMEEAGEKVEVGKYPKALAK